MCYVNKPLLLLTVPIFEAFQYLLDTQFYTHLLFQATTNTPPGISYFKTVNHVTTQKHDQKSLNPHPELNMGDYELKITIPVSIVHCMSVIANLTILFIFVLKNQSTSAGFQAVSLGSRGKNVNPETTKSGSLLWLHKARTYI